MKKHILNTLLITGLIGTGSQSMFASESSIPFNTESFGLLAQNDFDSEMMDPPAEGDEVKKKKKKKRKKRRRKRRKKRRGGKEHGAQEKSQPYMLDLSANLKVNFGITSASTVATQAAADAGLDAPESVSALAVSLDVASYYIIANRFGVGPLLSVGMASSGNVKGTNIGVGLAGRYYMGDINKDAMIFFGGLGAAYKIGSSSVTDDDGNALSSGSSGGLSVPVEVGMHWFLDSNITISPAAFFEFDMPLSESDTQADSDPVEVEVAGANTMNFGFKVGIGVFY